ncbi:hypothetical protein ACFLWR_05950 [Chloroflexota bacterium]
MIAYGKQNGKTNRLFWQFSFETGGYFLLGSPNEKLPELLFEKKWLIPAVQQLIPSH